MPGSDNHRPTRDAGEGRGVRFVLVEPQSGGNVGASARAIKNLGFRDLCLVSPRCDPLGDEARRMAVEARDVLEAAKIHADLDRALEGAATVVGTSRRTGKHRKPHRRLDDVAPDLARLARAGELAVVFGREAHGLSDAELDRCTHLVHFASSSEFPSFNLAQSVLLVAYEMRLALHRSSPEDPVEPPADHAAREAMYSHLETALRSIGFLHTDSAEVMMRRLRRMLGKASLTHGEVQILRGIAHQTLWLAGRVGLRSPRERENER
jgi:TrmH family RNA methyltransferase